jgi:hypothetical protein
VVVSGFPALEVYRHVKDLVLLVRPDRYVAATFPLAEIDSHAQAVGRLCDETRLKDDITLAGLAD